ncbi:hypothetical protein [Arthrobacter flavus]|uniref:Uncharacterized protein n=1 Tax=Arthrobacter flavus TaxID=95172 RepID=A0ABW4Q3R8_9MICC
MDNGEGQYERPDNAAILQRRYGVTVGRTPGLAAGRVVLNPHAFLKGWLVTFGIWALSTLLFCIASEIIGPNSGAVTVWGFTMMVSLVVALLVAAPLALVLGLLLRRVLNQWLHAVAFAVVFAGLAAATTVLVLPGTGSTLPLILAAVVGISAGVGRASIIRNVNP